MYLLVLMDKHMDFFVLVIYLVLSILYFKYTSLIGGKL